MGKWHKRIRSKFLLAMWGIGIIPILILGVIAFSRSYEALMDSHTTYGYTYLEIMNAELNSISSSMISFSRQLIASNGFKNTFANGHVSITALEKKRLDALVGDMSLLLDQPYYLLVFDGEKIYEHYDIKWGHADKKDVKITHVVNGDYKNEEWYLKTLANNGRETFFLEDVVNPGNGNFTMTKLLRDLDTGNPWGVMCLMIHMDALEQMVPATFNPLGTAYVLLDDAGESIVLGKRLKTGDFDPLQAAMENHSIASHYSGKTGWTLHYVLDRRIVFKNNADILWATLMTAICLIATCILVSIGVARTITRPLNRLRRAIDEMESTGLARGYTFDDDEVGRIGRRFIEMSEKIDALHQNVVRLSVKEKEAELKVLQAQINPHFLYNTLTSIYWLCKLNRSEDAAQAAILLSDAFKYSLNRDRGAEVFVDAELIHIERYLLLQNIRFDGKISVLWDVEDEIRPAKILKLILQPLVENAIYHGLEPKIGEWKICISGHRCESGIEFVIQDNGVGMVPGEIEKGFGASNVQERIRLYYGENYGCRYESVLGQGTTVTVSIPMVKGVEEG